MSGNTQLFINRYLDTVFKVKLGLHMEQCKSFLDKCLYELTHTANRVHLALYHVLCNLCMLIPYPALASEY